MLRRVWKITTQDVVERAMREIVPILELKPQNLKHIKCSYGTDSRVTANLNAGLVDRFVLACDDLRLKQAQAMGFAILCVVEWDRHRLGIHPEYISADADVLAKAARDRDRIKPPRKVDSRLLGAQDRAGSD